MSTFVFGRETRGSLYKNGKSTLPPFQCRPGPDLLDRHTFILTTPSSSPSLLVVRPVPRSCRPAPWVEPYVPGPEGGSPVSISLTSGVVPPTGLIPASDSCSYDPHVVAQDRDRGDVESAGPGQRGRQITLLLSVLSSVTLCYLPVALYPFLTPISPVMSLLPRSEET